MPEDLSSYTAERFCYLTTVGRASGRPHEIEIWFALDGPTLYMLSGNHGSDWVKNILHQPAVTVRIRNRIFSGTGRILEASNAEAVRARELIGPKYNEWQPDQPRTGWAWEALPVAVDFDTTK